MYTGNTMAASSVGMKHRLLAVLAVGLLAGPMAAQAAYNYTTIDYPGAVVTQAFGINDRGEIVGSASVDGVSTIGFVYDPKKNLFTVLPNVPDYDTGAIGINDSGVTVGRATDQNFFQSGFILDKGAFTLFDHPGSLCFTVARAVNNLGMVSGYADTDDCNTVSGFIYDPKSNAFIDFLPSAFTIAHGINNLGDVVGNTFFLDGFPGRWGFLRRSTGSIIMFQVNGLPTDARGINDAGLIAGDIRLPGGLASGFVISKSSLSSSVITVPTADLLDYPGAIQTIPEGISNSGVVVGIWVDGDGNNHGFLATPTK